MLCWSLESPLHIFDRATIKDNTIHIHALKSERILRLLMRLERQLVAGDTVISDSEKPLGSSWNYGGLKFGCDVITQQKSLLKLPIGKLIMFEKLPLV